MTIDELRANFPIGCRVKVVTPDGFSINTSPTEGEVFHVIGHLLDDDDGSSFLELKRDLNHKWTDAFITTDLLQRIPDEVTA